MNTIDAYHFGAWVAIHDGVKVGLLDEERTIFDKKRLMKAICEVKS